MLKIFQARLQQDINREIPDVQAGFTKGKKPGLELPTSTGPYRKQENSRKTSNSASSTMLKPLTVWITTNWKILKEMGIPDHLNCLLRNLYGGREATGRTLHEQLTGSKFEKEYDKAVYRHPVYLTYMQSTSCKMPVWMNHKL